MDEPVPPSEYRPPEYRPPVFPSQAGYEPPEVVDQRPVDVRSNRGRSVAVVAGLVAVALVVCAGVVVLLRSDDSSATAERPDGMLFNTFPDVPVSAWTVRADDLISGIGGRFTTTETQAASYNALGFVDAGDVIVVKVSAKQSDYLQLYGLDARDGSKLWSANIVGNAGCAAEVVDGVLPCVKSVMGDGVVGVDFIDIVTGNIRSTYDTPFEVRDVTTDGNSVFIAGYSGRGNYTELVLTKGTVADPESDWTRNFDMSGCPRQGSGDFIDVSVTDGIVDLAIGGTNAAALASNGSEVLGNAYVSSVVPGQGIVLYRCVANPMNPLPPVFASTKGERLYDGVASPESRILTVTTEKDPPVFLNNGTAIDFQTGDKRWERSEYEQSIETTSMVGDLLVVVGRGSVDGLDLATGDTRWSVARPDGWRPTTTDGTRVFGVSDGEVVGMSLADGSRAWSLNIDDGDADTGDYLGVADAGMVVMSQNAISLYTSTGPASTVPGSIAAAARAESSQLSDNSRYVTKCGSAPKIEVVETRNEPEGLVARVKITASCPGGDVMSSSATRISLTFKGANVASGTFDLSRSPIFVPQQGDKDSDGAVVQELTFPAGTFWRPANSLTNGDGASGSNGSNGGDILVECEQGGASTITSGQSGKSGGSIAAVGPARPATGDPEAAAFDALRAIADSDRPVVSSDLANRWIPQISSKRVGLVAEGRTWNNSETLREHLELRQRYPNVRLMWSGEWSTFDYRDFWVTATGVSFPDPGGALGWCAANQLDAEHCYAKLVSTTHPSEGSTVLQPK